MRIRTIIHQTNGFYISDKVWNSPMDAFRNTPEKFQYIGSRGWFGSDSNKKIYEILDFHYDLTAFDVGEYAEVDFFYSERERLRC
jgi:hypothetical protein